MILRSIKIEKRFLTLERPDNIAFKFDPNIQFITGPNGYGKTTLLNLIYQMILQDDLNKELKDVVGYVKLETSQGDIIYDEDKGGRLQKNIKNTPQILYKKQENPGYNFTADDARLILCDEEILKLANEYYMDDRDELVFDLNTGKMVFRNKKIGNTYLVENAPISIQNILMMFLFAKQTQKGDVLLLDMPEEHLHIVVQIELMEKLTSMCRGQIIVTTHSPSIFQHWGFSQVKDLYEIEKGNDDNNN